MFKLDRKAFLQLVGQGTAVIGFKSAHNAWSQKGSAIAATKETETDVAVIGAGPGGLSAALRAAQLGLKVCLFEKTDHTGGTLNGGMGPFGAGTHIQEKYGMKNCTPKDAFNYLMDFTHWQIDARLASEYINSTAYTIKWLEEEGVIFAPMGRGGRPDGFMHAISPHPEYKTDEKGMYMCMLLTDRVKANKNIRVFMETSVKKLTKTENAVTGLIASAKGGEEMKVKAKAVIIMTGGFMGSPEMIKKYTSYTYKKDLFHTYERPNICGDGINMAWDAGAAKAEMMIAAYKGMPILGGPSGAKNEWMIISNPNLMVNLYGQRFINEAFQDRHYIANAIHRQPKGYAFLMFDSTIADIYKAQGPGKSPDNTVTIPDVEQIVVEARKLNYPYLFAADSLEDLCKQTGIDIEALKSTIAEYNSCCKTGNDPVFYKDASYLRPLYGPKYYAAQFCCDSFGALGGIKINYKTEVVNDAFKPIPGLYAGGSDANTMYAGTYPAHLSGNFSGFAYTTGLMAATNAAEYLRASG
jgi:fumarate reductase flavoprotein subunit